MLKKNNMSFSGILLTGIMIAALLSAMIYGSMMIAKKFVPNAANVEKYLKKGKLDEAAAIADKIHGDEKTREFLRGKIFLAEALQKRKNTGWKEYGTNPTDWLQDNASDSSLACFRRVLELDPSSKMARYFIGIIYKEKGWFREAEDVLRTAKDLDSSNVAIRLALGSLYTSMSEYNDAVEEFKSVIVLDSHNAQASKNLAFLYRFHLENPESAIVWLHTYIDFAERGDVDINNATIELKELEKRYPEFIPPDVKGSHSGKRTFIPRFINR